MRIVVTGASGFIGRAVCARLSAAGDVEVTGTVGSSGRASPPGVPVTTRALAADTRWQDALDGVDVVVHTAARVHVVGSPDSLAEYRSVNVDGTMNLARQAADCGVKRFVFLSSVKVNGDRTPPGHAFRAEDSPAPRDAYGLSKHEAEVQLSRLAQRHAMEVVIVRPPLVYGPGVKANFLSLMRWVHKGYPLPFAGIRNRRSLLAVDNLVDLIRICAVHPEAANRTWMAADDHDVSTAELVTRIGIALDKPARLVTVPPKLLLALATVAGRRERADKLLGNLQVDARRTQNLLGWRPAVSMEQALEATARQFLEEAR